MTVINFKTWVALTATTVAVPATADGRYPAERLLVGFGIFIARCDGSRWRFMRRARAIPAGEAEYQLLEGMVDLLPAAGTLIGWDVDRMLISALFDAAATAPPTVAHNAVARLYQLVRGGVVDLTLAYGGASAPPLATIAADMAIYAPTSSADAVFSAWATGQVTELRHDLADEAMAIWRVFIRSAGMSGLNAEAATEAWLARRHRLQAARRARHVS